MSIRVIKGPMWSSKTSELIQDIRKAQSEVGPECVIAVKNARDNRYDATHIVSHNGTRHKAIAVPKLQMLEHIIEYYPHIIYVFIDEAQLFPDLVSFCIKMRDLDRHVVCAGLDLDFRREPFLSVQEVSDVANSCETLQAKCNDCGEPAPYTHLYKSDAVPKTGNISIGGADKYMPVCGDCYDKHN